MAILSPWEVTRSMTLINLVLFAMLAGQTTSARQAGTPADAAAKEVLQAIRQSSEDQAACRVEAWRATHTTDWMIVFPSGGVERVAGFLKECKPVKPTVYEDLQVRRYGDTTAIVTGQFRRGLPDGTMTRPNRITQVWVKQDGKWLNAHSHVTTIQEAAK
jgi:ketosteroid isomerase-like protein